MARVGLLPCGGNATRMPVHSAKELLPLPEGKTLLPVCEFSINQMLLIEADQIVVVTRTGKPELRRYLVNHPRFGDRIRFVRQTRFGFVGPSAGLLQALATGSRVCKDKDVFVGLPDTVLCPKDCMRVLQGQLQPGIDLVFGVFPTDSPQNFAPVIFNTHGVVSAVLDKPLLSPVDNTWGCMAWAPRFTRFLTEFERTYPEANLQVCLTRALAEGYQMRAVFFRNGSFVDVGTPSGWRNYLKESWFRTE